MNALTMSVWARIVTDRNDYSDFLSAYITDRTTNSLIMGTQTDGVGLQLMRNWTDDTIQTTLTVGAWYFLAFTSGADQRLYWAPDGATTLSSVTFGRTNTGTVTGLQIGCSAGTTDEQLDGEMREVRVWSASTPLTQSELEAEMLSAMPVRTLNLMDRLPLADAASVASETSGNANTWSVNGSFTTGASDPAIFGSALELEGYRWRNDDGSESAATWAAAQDASLTAPSDAVRRLRMLINATGDPLAAGFQLEYRKVGDPTWKAVA